jgi:predicted anti-sigma-YlaC factor YlaD
MTSGYSRPPIDIRTNRDAAFEVTRISYHQESGLANVVEETLSIHVVARRFHAVSALCGRNALLILGAVITVSGCSVQQLAVSAFSDTLASGGSVFESDNDPVLIGEALPFSLKLMDSLLEEQPDNGELLIAASRGYLLYAYAYVDLPAERQSLVDLQQARQLRERARNLYLRAQGYALRALETDYPGIGVSLYENPSESVEAIGRDQTTDVAVVYWNAASLGLAISVSRNEATLLARIPEVEALLARALELDEEWNSGALHEFALSLAAARTTTSDRDTLEAHYARALELSRGERASLYIAFAEAVAVPTQDRRGFIELLEQALGVDVDADPANRLMNLVSQDRARWLLDRVDEIFL